MEFSVVIHVTGARENLHEFVQAKSVEEASVKALQEVADQFVDWDKTVISVTALR